MTELNEYQRKANAQAVEFHDLLQPIVDQMPEGWSLKPLHIGDDGHAWRCCFIVNVATGLEIMARYNEYDIRGKFEFSAVQWPKYTNESGQDCTTGPADCYQPREQAPKTKAAAGRAPKAIAAQIVSKILPDYERIYTRCEGLAADSQVYHDTTKDALDKLTAATGDDRHSIGRTRSGWYLQDLPGSQRIEFHSTGDVEIRLPTEEMLKVIDLLYRLRTGKPREQDKYWACEECGCTDIEMTAWVEVNPDLPTQDEPPTDQSFCPQCEATGQDGVINGQRYAEVEERKPFVPLTDTQRELFAQGPECGHSACSQNYIDTGEPKCISTS